MDALILSYFLGTAAGHRLCTGTSQAFPSPTTEYNLLVCNNLENSCGPSMNWNASILFSWPHAAGVTRFPTDLEIGRDESCSLLLLTTLF